MLEGSKMNKALFFNISIFFPIGFILAFRQATSFGELELVKFLSTWALFSVPLIIYLTYKAILGRNSKNK
tara:strand:- start:11 stop:220 length:210 start_codon:yes stop_codon:yes gene_type:complete